MSTLRERGAALGLPPRLVDGIIAATPEKLAVPLDLTALPGSEAMYGVWDRVGGLGRLMPLLKWPIPLQCRLPPEDIHAIALKYWYPQGHRILPGVRARALVRLARQRDSRLFPVKAVPAARTKVNVLSYQVVRALSSNSGAALLHELGTILYCALEQHWTDDQVCGALLWWTGARQYSPALALAIASDIGDQSKCKSLSTFMKMVGTAGQHALCVFCECDVLAGRGHGTVPDQDILDRGDLAGLLATKLARIPPEALRDHIRRVIRGEVRGGVSWGDVDDVWSKRWAWVKGGSQSRAGAAALGVVLPKRRLTRRDLVESTNLNLIARGPPRVVASFSQKLEHGKRRALYSCDTVSYCTFHYLLDPVERAWRNHRVLLDPGKNSSIELCATIAHELPCWCLSLDYTDFNSQHSVCSMKMVIEEACVGAPQHVLDWCTKSFDHTVIKSHLPPVRVKGTLMSGHRATAFINSILNAAYISFMLDDLYTQVRSFHCGDDVILMTNDVTPLNRLLSACLAGVVRINPAKQCLGRLSGEFLRMSIGQKRACGYLARSVAATVSGSWDNDKPLSDRERLAGLMAHLWTLCQRSGSLVVNELLQSTISRHFPVLRPWAGPLSTLACSIDGSPVLRAMGRRIITLNGVYSRVRPPEVLDRPAFASQAYLDRHVDHGLLELIDVGKGGVLRAMASTMSSADPLSAEGRERLTAIRLGATTVHAAVSVSAVKKGGDKGLLSGILPLPHIRHLIDSATLGRIFRYLGLEPNKAYYSAAWGDPSVAMVYGGGVPIAECRRVATCFKMPSYVAPSFPTYV